MTTLTTTPTIAVAQDPVTAAEQLHADLRAVTDGTDPIRDADAVVSRPSILRRLAAGVAERLPPDTDRILSGGGPDALLGTAVALHSGIPAVVIDPDGRFHGDVHPGERVALVKVLPDADTVQVREQAERVGATVLVRLTGIGESAEELPSEDATP